MMPNGMDLSGAREDETCADCDHPRETHVGLLTACTTADCGCDAFISAREKAWSRRDELAGAMQQRIIRDHPDLAGERMRAPGALEHLIGHEDVERWAAQDSLVAQTIQRIEVGGRSRHEAVHLVTDAIRQANREADRTGQSYGLADALRAAERAAGNDEGRKEPSPDQVERERRSGAAKKAATTRRRKAAAKKAATTKRRSAAATKAALTKRRTVAGKKAAATRRRKTAAKKAAVTRGRKEAATRRASPEDGEKAVVDAFWTDARCVVVRFERRDPPLERLIAELRHVSGIYSLEVGGQVLRIGLSGQRTTRNETSGLGQRLLHHLDAAYGDQAARKAEFYDHFEFHSALIGRAMTIRWMPCPHETLQRAERAAIGGAPGGVLWERLRSERLAVKRDPARRGELANVVKAALDSAPLTPDQVERERRSAAAKKAAAATRRRKAAAKKAATTKRRAAAGTKAALTKRRRAAGKKAAATRRAKVTK